MPQFNHRTSLITLSIAAFILLWGGMLWNGTIDAMNLAQEKGYFPDGRPLKLVYTGIPPIDSLAATLVAFFDGISNGQTRGPKLLMTDFCATLQMAGFLTVIGGARNGQKPLLLQYPAILVTVWNILGAATLFPIYCLVDLSSTHSKENRVPLNTAKALIPAAFMGLALPYMFVLFPFTPTTVGLHQSFIALYQFSPLICWAISSLTATILTKQDSGKHDLDDSSSYIRAAYLLGAGATGIAHISIVLTTIFTTDPTVSLRRLYMPNAGAVKLGNTDLITEGAHLFMQFDFIIVCLAGAIYAFQIWKTMVVELSSEQTEKNSSARNSKAFVTDALQTLRETGVSLETALGVVVAASIIVIGPGATASLTLLARELLV